MDGNAKKIIALGAAAAIVAVAGFFLFNNGATNIDIEQQENRGEEETEQTNNISEENMENSTGSESLGQEPNNVVGQEDRRVVKANTTSLQFSGTAFGFSFQGTFKDITGEVELANNQFAKALLRIKTDSVDAGNFLVNSQLKGEDFLDTKNHPEIVLRITGVEFTQGANANVSAQVTIRGVTHSFEFPAAITDSNLSADFTVDLSEFGISHPNVDKDIRMQLAADWSNTQ